MTERMKTQIATDVVSIMSDGSAINRPYQRINRGATVTDPIIPTPTVETPFQAILSYNNPDDQPSYINRAVVYFYHTVAGASVEINWGDGTVETIPSSGVGSSTMVEHYYADKTDHPFSIKTNGELTSLIVTNVKSVLDWGSSIKRSFRIGDYRGNSKSTLISVPDHLPSYVTSMSNMFNSDFSSLGIFNDPNVSNWDTSNVTNMNSVLKGQSIFNQPLNWDTSNVTTMYEALKGCYAFNQPLNHWIVSKVTNFIGMLAACTVFNQPLDTWDMTLATSLDYLFSGARAFNQPLNMWNVSNVTSMNSTFDGAWAFNQPLDNWDVSKVIGQFSMDYMFSQAQSFSQDLSSWCVTNILSEPYNFNTGGLLTNLQKPVWGTCPA